MAIAMPGRTPFVGREADLGILLGLARDARAGDGSVVLVGGEAGIGKSRLTRELIAAFRSEGAEAASGAAHDDAADSFGPVAELFRDAIRRAGSDDRERLQEAYGSLGESARSVLDTLSAGIRPHLFESAAEAFGRAACGSPPLCVLVLEDLHWADASSLQLVLHLARRARENPYLLVCTFRPEQAIHPALAGLADAVRQEHLGVRLTLHPLSDTDAAAVVRAAMPEDIDEREVAEIIRRGDGNPLFLEELARSRLGSWARKGEAGAIPEAIGDLVRRRLQELPESVRALAAAAAVLGDEATVAQIAELCVAGFVDAATGIDQLAAAGLIVQERLAVGFRHALIRDALYTATSLSLRHRLHLAAAALLEREVGPAAAAPIASHLEAAGTGDAIRASIGWRVLAARRALGMLAFEDAVEQAGAAARSIGRHGSDPTLRLECELLRAEAARQTGAADQALAGFSLAADLAAEACDSLTEARAALGYEFSFLVTGRPRSHGASRSVELLDRALDHVEGGPEQDGIRARLLAASAQARFFGGDATTAHRLSTDAIEAARSSADKGATAAALEARRMVIWGPANLVERTSLTQTILELGEAAHDNELTLEGLYWLVACRLEQGAMAEARAAVRRFAALAGESHQPRRASEAARMLGMLAVLDGDLALGRRLADESLAEGERAGLVDARVHYAAQMVEILRDTDEGVAFVNRLTADSEAWLGSPTRRALLSALFARIGRVADAGALIDGLARQGFEALPRDWMWFPLMFLVSEAIGVIGNPQWAGVVYQQLVPFADRFVVNSNTVCYGSIEFALGTLAATAGWKSAHEHFLAAAERNRLAGAGLWIDRARKAAQQLNERGPDPHDPTIASASHLPAGITPREAEVLMLIAAGNSNQQIADQLVLSVRTVERHITNLYGKINARGKADATVFALRHGLDR